MNCEKHCKEKHEILTGQGLRVKRLTWDKRDCASVVARHVLIL